jgi:hypothetical protein
MPLGLFSLPLNKLERVMLHKAHKVVRSKSGEILEEFATPDAAAEFMEMMQAKGEDVIIKTDDDDRTDKIEEHDDSPNTFDIDGLDESIIEPEVEFGSDMDDMFSDDDELIELE